MRVLLTALLVTACSSSHEPGDGGADAAADAAPPSTFHGCDDPRTWETAPAEALTAWFEAGNTPCFRLEAPLALVTVRVQREDGDGIYDAPVCVRVAEATPSAGLAAGDVLAGEGSVELFLPSAPEEARLEARAWVDGHLAASAPFEVRHAGAVRLRSLVERPVAMVPTFAGDAASVGVWLLYADRVEGPLGTFPTRGTPLGVRLPSDRRAALVLETSEADGLWVRDPFTGDTWPVGPHDPDARFVPGPGPDAVITGGWIRFPRYDVRPPIELPVGARDPAQTWLQIAVIVDETVRMVFGDPLEGEPPTGVERLAVDGTGSFFALVGDAVVPIRRPDAPHVLPTGARAAIGPVLGVYADYGPLLVAEDGLAIASASDIAGSGLAPSSVLGGRIVDYAEQGGFVLLVVEAADGSLSLHAMQSQPVGCL
ncbi:MAG: hypothetical protein KC619_05000 [Myxococcales bacterium]|nr:hypothetical protein [Myxococcales bacterium]